MFYNNKLYQFQCPITFLHRKNLFNLIKNFQTFIVLFVKLTTFNDLNFTLCARKLYTFARYQLNLNVMIDAVLFQNSLICIEPWIENLQGNLCLNQVHF